MLDQEFRQPTSIFKKRWHYKISIAFIKSNINDASKGLNYILETG